MHILADEESSNLLLHEHNRGLFFNIAIFFVITILISG